MLSRSARKPYRRSRNPYRRFRMPSRSSRMPSRSSGTRLDASGTCPDASETCPDTSGTYPDASETCPDASGTCPDASETCPDASGTCPGASGTCPDDSETFPVLQEPVRSLFRSFRARRRREVGFGIGHRGAGLRFATEEGASGDGAFLRSIEVIAKRRDRAQAFRVVRNACATRATRTQRDEGLRIARNA